MENLAQFVDDGQWIAVLYVCEQMVILQAALGNGKLHGINGTDTFVRRPWAAGHLTASLNKDFAVSRKKGEVLTSHEEMFVSKEDTLGREMVLLGEVWLRLGHEEVQKSKISVRAMEEQTAQAGSCSGKMSSFPLKTPP